MGSVSTRLALVVTAQRQTRRQIARALHSGGFDVRFLDTPVEVAKAHEELGARLLILDRDNGDPEGAEQLLQALAKSPSPPPVILLSIGDNQAPLMALLLKHEIGNLVAKHGAIRATHPVLDERELLVTCEKVLQRDIFGIDKYIGNWGVVLHRAQITKLADKEPVLEDFEAFLKDLDCPDQIIPMIVTVMEELILNAVIHAPRLPDGTPKYEDLGPVPHLKLEPSEYVDVCYGCDGQRLMVSVSDRFGRLSKQTLYNYLLRGFHSGPIAVESKRSGAGLGLSLAVRQIHQLIFNVQDTIRTEAIAGWYLRVATSGEFHQVGKSLNLFWLPASAHVTTVPEPELVQTGSSITKTVGSAAVSSTQMRPPWASAASRQK